MANNNLELPLWEGFSITHSQHDPDGIQIWLSPQADAGPVCSRCGLRYSSVHATYERVVRDLPILGHPVRLHVQMRRVSCQHCGTCSEAVSWLERHARVTRRLAEFVALWCEKLPVAHVCQLTGLHWETVRRIERDHLERQLASLPPAQPTRLIMDEFALFKGHRYATVVLDADTRQVLWVGEGRSRESLRPFFQWLGADRCARVEAVAMDMNTAFDLELRLHCPQARVVYDLFHVIAKYGREVIDRVRVDEANRLRHDRPLRRVIKRARWLLLRNRDNIPSAQQPSLDELLQANHALMSAYVMKSELKELWQASDPWQWRRAWKNWLAMAANSGVEPLKQFARKLAPYWRGILARTRWPMHTGKLEGINNRIKVMKRMAYGYRDTAFFFMKIKAAFHGNP